MFWLLIFFTDFLLHDCILACLFVSTIQKNRKCSVASCKHNGSVLSLVNFSDVSATILTLVITSSKSQIFCGIALTRLIANLVYFFRRNIFFEYPFLNTFPMQLQQSLFLYPAFFYFSPQKSSTSLMISTAILNEDHQICTHGLFHLGSWPGSSTTIWTFVPRHLSFISKTNIFKLIFSYNFAVSQRHTHSFLHLGRCP